MQLQVATLCDSAADYQGKLCILGAFDTLYAHEFPVVHPQCSLALRILFDYADQGRREMAVRLFSESGTELIPPYTPTFEVLSPPGYVPFVARHLVLNLQGLRFERPGVYRFVVTMSQQTLTTIPLRVTRFEERRSAEGPAG
jgi:hypothetical protein